MSDLLIQKAAHISDCGTYRYSLTRQWADGRLLPFVMLNPSTADADVDDPTIRRCMGFARGFGCAGIHVVNLYALRSTSPKVLKEAADPFGPGNGAALLGAVDAGAGGPVVCAWGSHGPVRGGDASALTLFRSASADLRCLGKTKDGHPKHPLYIAASQALEMFL